MIQSGIAIRLSNLSGHVWTLRQFPPRRRARASLRRSEPAAESRAHVDMAPTRRAPVVRLLKDGVALLSNFGPVVLMDFGPPPAPQPTVARVDRGAWRGLESQSGFVRA